MDGSAMDDDRSDELEQSDADDSNSSSSSSTSSSTSSSSSASTTSASSDTSSSDDTTGASNGNDALELAQFDKTVLRLPRGLCENAAIFAEFFSLDTWHLLPESMRIDLQQRFLPSFASPHVSHEKEAVNGAEEEQKQTLVMLFAGKLDRFGHTPLGDLQRRLEEGNYRPDVLKLRRSIAKSRRREWRFQHCEQLSQLSKELFLSRERLLHEVYQSAPDTDVPNVQSQLQRAQRRQRSSLLLYADTTLSAVRARKRFRAELNDMMQVLGIQPDELSTVEDDEGDSSERRDGAALLNGEEFKCPPSNTDKYVFGSHFKRHHELSDEDAVRRDHHAKQPRLSNRNFRRYLLDHKRRKLSEPMLPDFETSDIRLRDVCARAQLGGNFKRLFGAGKGRKPRPKLATKPLSEPPALVPIAPHHSAPHMLRQTEETRPSSNVVSGSKQQQQEQPGPAPFKQEHSVIGDVEQAAAFDRHIHGMDGEVEMQQVEVETFEETIPAFVISSNEVVLPQVEMSLEMGNNNNYNSSVLPENVFQTPEKERRRREEQSKRHLVDKLPRLEPIITTARDKLTKPLSASSAPLPTPSPNKNAKNSHAAAASKAYMTTANNNVSTAELIQETHASFFSLIRDFFCATPHHRMRYDELRGKIEVWLRNPITALNDWYTLTASWSALLHSAIDFLAGDCAANEQPNEYVPYIEHKTQLGIYQWIGAGRDSDNRLSALCLHWLQQLRVSRGDASGEMSSVIQSKLHHDDVSALLMQQSTLTTAAPLLRRRSTATDCGEDIESIAGASVPSQPPPPPARSPTTWTVRTATSAEVAEFQRQERERFEQPHRAYTYHMYGYESVVGPVKGIYSRLPALTKARGHSMMVGDRPNFITILTLVRDATARLPNGEGTRADISELLKCSQYISPDAAENVLQTIVSGALDRMHTENDPCVRYDPKRKIWIYLHRSRSVEEFERMHQQQQGVGGKNRKPTATGGRKQKTPKTSPVGGLKGTATADGLLTDISSGGAVLVGSSPGTAIASGPSNFPLPALVPANPIIVNSAHQSAQQQTKQPVLAKYPPVPPLKYNIPPSTHSHQQQKSLLKTTLNTQRQQQQQVEVKTAVSTVTAATTNASNKHFSFTMPQASKAAATPLLMASGTNAQSVHGSVPGGSPLSSATLISGKKVALSKPIIINQIAGTTGQQTFQGGPVTVGATPKTKVQQQQQQQLHQTVPKQQQLPSQRSFIIPISNSSGGGGDGQQVVIDSNHHQQLVSNSSNESGSLASPHQPKQVACVAAPGTTAKNIIRLVPAATVSSAAGVVKQPMQLIGQRVIAKQPQQQQQKPLGAGGISIISGGQIGQVGGSGGTIVKMSPQAFASLQQAQQKQGQHILFKQQQQSPPQKQRLIVGNTAIIASSAASSASKGHVLQQMSTQSASTPPSAKSAAVGIATATSVAGQVAAPATGKIQTINASNLTVQQQRVLLQNLRLQPPQQQQQQQQMQFKTVQVVANAQSKQQQSDPAKNQTLMVTSPQRVVVSSAPMHTAQQQQMTGKTVAVVVSQSQQGLTRVLKTTTASTSSIQQQHQGPITTNAPTTGKIISLESLLQRQGGALRISGVQKSISAPVSQATSSTMNNSIIQLSSSAASGTGGSVAAQQYTVVGQPRNIITLSGGATTPVQRVQSSSTGFNLAQFQGKQVVFTTKSSPGSAGVKTLGAVSASQAQQMQQAGVIIGGQTVKLQGSPHMQQLVSVSKAGSGGGQPASSQLQTVIMGNQILRVQQMQPQQMKGVANRIAMSPVTTVASNASTSGTMVVNSSDATSLNSVVNAGLPRTLVLGSTGQSIRLQPSGAQTQVVMPKNVVVATSQQNLTKGTVVGAPTANRVVLAVQGGGQVFLSPNFQGGTLKLNSLQNLKVVSLAQTPTTSTSKDVTQQGEKLAATVNATQNTPILKTCESGTTSGGS